MAEKNTDEEIVETEEEVVDDEVDEEEETSDEAEEDNTPAPVRKSAAYYVGLRQGKKAAKSEGQDLTPKAQEAIRKELEPVVKGLAKTADDLEIREYLESHPEKRKFEAQIRKRAETWKDVPIAEIGKTVGEESSTEKTKKREETVAKIQGKRLGGSSDRAQEAKLPTTPAEHKEIYARVKRGEQLNLETGQWERASGR